MIRSNSLGVTGISSSSNFIPNSSDYDKNDNGSGSRQGNHRKNGASSSSPATFRLANGSLSQQQQQRSMDEALMSTTVPERKDVNSHHSKISMQSRPMTNNGTSMMNGSRPLPDHFHSRSSSLTSNQRQQEQTLLMKDVHSYYPFRENKNATTTTSELDGDDGETDMEGLQLRNRLLAAAAGLPSSTPAPLLSPILFSSTTTTSDSILSSNPTSASSILSNLSRPSFWNDLSILLLLDVMHVLIATSVPQSMIRKQVIRRRRQQEGQHELGRSIKTANPSTNPSTITESSRPQSRRRQRRFSVGTTARGIPNYGNTCFLNSVLQSLASVKPFVMHLERLEMSIQHQQEELLNPQPQQQGQIRHSQHNKNNGSEGNGNVITVLTQLLHDLNGQVLVDDDTTAATSASSASASFLDPRPLMKLVGLKHKQFRISNREQQDAQEFLQVLMDMIVEQSNDISHAATTAETACTEIDSKTTVAAAVDEWKESSLSLSSFLSEVIKESDKENDKEEEDDASCHTNHPSEENNISMDMKLTLFHESATKTRQEEDEDTVEEEKKHDDMVLPTTSTTTIMKGHVNEDDRGMNLDHVGLLVMDDETSPVSDDNSSSRHFLSKPEPDQAFFEQILSRRTSSPLSGWIGSTLQCAECRHVRPIQNTPFLDIPLVTTSLSNYLHGGNGNPPSKHSPSSRYPSCSLGACLEQFTVVERVSDVECRNCTIQNEIATWEEEMFMLEGAVQSLKSRLKNKATTTRSTNGEESATTTTLSIQADLDHAKKHLQYLYSLDPDERDAIPVLSGSARGGPHSPLDDCFASTMDHMYPTDDQHCSTTPSSNMNHNNTNPPVPLRRCDALKCLLLTRLPTIACFHIQRRYFDIYTGMYDKTVQHVDFDEVMDLGRYCAYSGGNDNGMTGKRVVKPRHTSILSSGMTSSNTTPISLYKLMSVIEHQGNAFSGHYVVYRRDLANPTQWLLISDQIVKPTSWSQVKACQAYMLFYEAII